MNLLRHAVSKQKRRYVDKETGLDLDLTYITATIIAMGYPSRSLEAFYRNSMNDVERFLDGRHAMKYKVYNLCSERSYSNQRFQGRVAEFPFPDHSPPPFQLIHPFCEDVSDWLHSATGNVVAVHCKAGKGRTGVMICAYLVHCGATAQEAIQWYGSKRTFDGAGVTIPSQLRYINYYEQFVESRTLNYDPRLLVLKEIVIETIPKPLLSLEPGSDYLILTILSSDKKIYESLPKNSRLSFSDQKIRITIPEKIVLAGDVKMVLWYDSSYKRSHLCHFFFNTTFIPTEDSLRMSKSEVDKACKDKLHTIFDREFAVNVNFSPALAQQSPLPTLDTIPSREVMLQYNNQHGPNNVQIVAPYFSTVKGSAAQQEPQRPRLPFPGFLTLATGTLDPFGVHMPGIGGGSGSDNLVKNHGNNNKPPSPLAPTISSPLASRPGAMSPAMTSNPTSPIIGPARIAASPPIPSRSAFKPVWSDKSAMASSGNYDDNWDTASVSSDCSESETSSEWWYTPPPFAKLVGGVTGNNSAIATPLSPSNNTGSATVIVPTTAGAGGTKPFSRGRGNSGGDGTAGGGATTNGGIGGIHQGSPPLASENNFPAWQQQQQQQLQILQRAQQQLQQQQQQKLQKNNGNHQRRCSQDTPPMGVLKHATTTASPTATTTLSQAQAAISHPSHPHYRTPPTSALSPLGREIKFDRPVSSKHDLDMVSWGSVDEGRTTLASGGAGEVKSKKKSSTGHDGGSRGDSGTEDCVIVDSHGSYTDQDEDDDDDLGSNGRRRRTAGQDLLGGAGAAGVDGDRTTGWVDSMSRWLWPVSPSGEKIS